MTGPAASERAELCNLLERVGPAHPTLCTGWATADLAAHLVLRDRRPDAAAGIAVRALAGRTNAVQQDLLRTRAYAELIELIRTGPPRWSPIALAWLDDAVNTAEYFVHHEDVRRAAEGWAPRRLDPALDDRLWERLRRAGRVLFRRAPVPVSLRRAATGQTVTVRRSGTDASGVVLTGTPGELMMFAYNRKDHAVIEEDGEPALVAALRGARLGI